MNLSLCRLMTWLRKFCGRSKLNLCDQGTHSSWLVECTVKFEQNGKAGWGLRFIRGFYCIWFYYLVQAVLVGREFSTDTIELASYINLSRVSSHVTIYNQISGVGFCRARVEKHRLLALCWQQGNWRSYSSNNCTKRANCCLFVLAFQLPSWLSSMYEL